WQFPRNQRRLGPQPRALLGHATADLGLRSNRQDGSRRQLRRATEKARRERPGSLASRQKSQAITSRRPPCPQALYRRRYLRLTIRHQRANESRPRSHRLLVRQWRNALRPMGLSALRPREI